MICILAPTATSAPVVANILGGNIASVAAFSMFSNISVAFVAPLYLSLIGHSGSEVRFSLRSGISSAKWFQ
jgi:BASS family bile acid:Na+ symporter